MANVQLQTAAANISNVETVGKFILLVGAGYLAYRAFQGTQDLLSGLPKVPDSYGRGVGGILGCNNETEDLDTGLCFPKCSNNYTGVGPICWARCGNEWESNGGTDDGAYCRKGNYSRGVGRAISGCAAGYEKQGALCYPACREGYYGVGPVCWQRCNDGYTDDGLTCRADASIISANNSNCPWYDQCGLTLARGCSTCPSGYTNDGCTCRRDAHIYGKDSYTRTAGQPLSCNSNEDYDAGLCYTKCRQGYSGVGPICWQTPCPMDTTDIGVSCEKKTYGRGAGTVIYTCPTGQESDTGLCYENCAPGFHGIGPVCWENI